MSFSHSQAKGFYDRFGSKQDRQAFYEDPSINQLVSAIRFGAVHRIFEFGCGTGRFGRRLLEKHLSADASYVGADVSPVMVGLARQRLASFADRAEVRLTDGSISFPIAETSVDLVISTYVLDLLADEDIRRFIGEAGRVLRPGGQLALAGITGGVDLRSRALMALWKVVYRLNPSWLGGCRPIQLPQYLDSNQWDVFFRGTVSPYGVSSEAIAAQKR